MKIENPSSPNIVLVGFMGTGKTSSGKRVASALGLPCVDTDELIEEESGRKISDIFAEDGEPFFRDLERAVVKKVSETGGKVVTAGGGVVLDPCNIDEFGRNGIVICLRASTEAILSRVSDEYHRPLLEGGEKARKVTEILEARKPLYDAVPHQIQTDGHTPEDTASEVIRIYRDAVQS